jgi:hypothetical protein
MGLSVTAALSGAARATIDATRTLFVWLVSLAAGWESFHGLQVRCAPLCSLGWQHCLVLHLLGFLVVVVLVQVLGFVVLVSGSSL